MPEPPRPDIGDVRFLAVTSLTATYGNIVTQRVYMNPRRSENVTVPNANQKIIGDINNGTFDGWVFPDGTTYYQYQGHYDFSEACQKFGGRNGQFTVPSLSNFFKTNPGQRCNDALAAMPG